MDKHHTFDEVADIFHQNIDQHRKGRIRRALIHRDLEHCLPTLDEKSLNVLEIGAGAGHTTLWLASKGHQVTAVEPSPKMRLAAQKNQQANAPNLTIHWIDKTLEQFEPHGTFDLVIAHAVLEWTDDPDTNLRRLWDWVKPGGYLSLAFFNAHARRLKQMIRGEVPALQGTLRRGRSPLTPRHWFCPELIKAKLASLGGICIGQTGLRCVSDLLPKRRSDELSDEALIQLEERYRHALAFQLIAPYVHQIWHRPAEGAPPTE
jgi:S-adenosylmethionine-dependent methyltransferase